jgi:amphi-Trp domain-containing protein
LGCLKHSGQFQQAKKLNKKPLTIKQIINNLYSIFGGVMGKETRLFKSQEKKNRTDVSTFLHQLADKVSQGTIVLSKGSEELTLQIPQNLILEIQVEDEQTKKKGVQHSLEVEIKWFDNDDVPTDLKLK